MKKLLREKYWLDLIVRSSFERGLQRQRERMEKERNL